MCGVFARYLGAEVAVLGTCFAVLSLGVVGGGEQERGCVSDGREGNAVGERKTRGQRRERGEERERSKRQRQKGQEKKERKRENGCKIKTPGMVLHILEPSPPPRAPSLVFSPPRPSFVSRRAFARQWPAKAQLASSFFAITTSVPQSQSGGARGEGRSGI